MKVIGAIAFVIGAMLLLIWVAAWIALVAEHGPAEAVRLEFTLWPGNAVAFALLTLSIAIVGSGLSLLNNRHQNR